MKRLLRVAATLVVTALAVTYVLTKIDLGKTLHILGSASPGWVILSAALTLVTVPPMAWRWQRLLAAREVVDGVGWLTRAYFVSYAFGQVLPTSVGGDAWRIFETSRRHPGNITPITGSILLERSLGGAVTLVLAGAGLLLAIGRYPIGPYLWIEVLFVLATIAAGFVFFSRSVRRRLAFALPYARRHFGPAVQRLHPRFTLPSHQDDFFQPLDRGFIFGKLTDFPEVLRAWKREELPGKLILLDYFRPWTLR